MIYSCPLSEACLGYLNTSDYTGTCAAGYQGHKCNVCEIGYSLASSGKCSQCPSTEVNIVLLIFIVIFVVFVAFIMVRSTLQSAFSPKSLYSIYIKIFTNYLQIVFLTTQFNLEWPSYVIQLFTVQKSAATASDQIFSLDCYFTNDKTVDSETLYYNKIILAALLPPAIWSISFFV